MKIKASYIIISILLLFGVMPSFAQKSKSKHQDSKLREAEYYFTEGEKYFILEDYAKALVLFQKSLDIDSENATIYYKIGEIYSKGNELQKALEYSLKALELDNSNKYFYLLVANVYTQLGNFEKAAETYENLIVKIEKTDIYLFELAALYLYQQKFNEALNTYDKVEKSYGISEEIIYQKQKIYLQQNKLEEALKEGNKLIDTYPEEEAYVVNQSNILISNNRKAEAKSLLSRYLENNPNGYQSRLILAEMKRRDGDLEGALHDLTITFENPNNNAQNKIQLLAEYRSSMSAANLNDFALPLAKIVVNTHPDIADAHIIYADILQQLNKSKEAKFEYKSSIKLDPSNIAVWQNLIQLNFQLNEIDSALSNSDTALELFPNQGLLYYFNGVANLQKGNNEEAVFSLEQGKRLSSSNLTLLGNINALLGDAYNNVEEFQKSDQAYEAALDFDPSNDLVLNNYSYFLSLRKEKLDKAEEMSRLVTERNPKNVTYLDTYAWVLYAREKYKEAKKVMEKAIEIGGVEAIHFEHYGDILFKLGRKDEAVDQWKIAKEMNSDSKLLDKKITDRKLYE